MRIFGFIPGLLCAATLWLAPPASAQQLGMSGMSAAEISAQTEDDKGFITRFLQEKLSGAGRSVVIDGFRGALSSRASFERMTISDGDGAWITLHDGAIQWNRSRLLRGVIEIGELSAREIDLPRLPSSGEDGPTPEAKPFNLPELPVGIFIDQIEAQRVNLGPEILGQEATMSVSGQMQLADGEGSADVQIKRLDGTQGEFSFVGGFDNESRMLRVNLGLDEAANGIFVRLTGLHGRPAVKAQIIGEGPLDNFTATLDLATDGQPRIKGDVALRAEPGPDGKPGRGVSLDIGGDVAALVPQDSRPFFGPNTKLVAKGWRADTGRILVPELSVQTDALNIAGNMATNDAGAPVEARLTMLLGDEAGAPTIPVRLPASPVMVDSGRLDLEYDAAKGANWTLDGWLSNLDTEGMRIAGITLTGDGEVALSGETLNEVTGAIRFDANYIQPDSPALARAIGDSVSGATNFAFTPGQAVEMTALNISGADYALGGDLIADGLASGIVISGEVNTSYRNLARLSDLLGRDMSGATEANITGYYQMLTRGFDAEIAVKGQDITISQPQADRMLRGTSEILLSARRDENGIELRTLDVQAQRAALTASGIITSASTDLKGRLSVPSLDDLDPRFNGALEAEIFVNGPPAARRLTLSGEGVDLALGQAELDRAFAGRTSLSVIAQEKDQGAYDIERFALSNPQLRAEGTGQIKGEDISADLDFEMPDLAALGRGFAGQIAANAQIRTQEDGTQILALDGTGRDLKLGTGPVDRALNGPTKLTARVTRKDDTLTISQFDLNNAALAATATGVIAPEGTDARADLRVDDLAVLGIGASGRLNAEARLLDAGTGTRRFEISGTGDDLAFGNAAQTRDALRGRTRFSAQGTQTGQRVTITQAEAVNDRARITASGVVAPGETNIEARYDIASLGFAAKGLTGATSGTASMTDTGNGTRRLRAQGTASGLGIGQAKIDPILAGQTRYDLAARQGPDGLEVERLNVTNPQLDLKASGDPQGRLDVDATLADLGQLAPGLRGPLRINGQIAQTGPDAVLDLDATAPGGTRAKIAGRVARNGTDSNLRITGIGDAALANPFLRTRSIDGPISFDVAMNGRPGLDALSGTLSLRGGTLAEPRLGMRLVDLNADARLQDGRIALDATGAVQAGGRVAVGGSIGLQGDRPIDLNVAANDFVFRDPNLYELTASADLRVLGQLGGAEAPLVQGLINISEAEFRIPATGLGGAKAIPDITHRGDTAAVRATRARAGLEPFGSGPAREAGLPAPAATPPEKAARFDLRISAPDRVFVRGRGVDAELGGEIELRGNARNVIPIGHLDLIRGRVDLLGKRFDLDEGLIELQGSLVPIMRLVAIHDENQIVTRIIIDGPLREPDIRFESTPELPQEEVLSQLLFGRGLDNISALQAAQLANALAVLAGKGGIAVVGNLRESVGLDDLDLTTNDDGDVSVRAGKYLTEKVYTDVEVDSEGTSRVNLNLDLTPNLTARGSTGTDGESAVGLFYEKDY